jgi:predicted permease
MRVFRLSESRPDPRRDVEEEIDFHLEMRAREFMERGLSPDDARRAAAASFGDVRAIEAECASLRRHRARERARRDWLVGLGLDVKVATRALWKRPVFAAAVITTLALGIGAAAAVFAIVAGVLLRPMPYRDPQQLVMVWLTGPDVRGPASQLPLSAPIYLDLQRGARVFESIAAFRSWPYTLTDGAEPEQIMGVQASPALFATLGVRPTIGRALTDSDAVRGAPNVAVISDALWRRRYGADPDILGRPISLDAKRFTVVGVAPREFAFPRGAELPSGLQFPTRTDIWTPIKFSDQDLANRFTLNLAAVARVRHGITAAAANAEIREFGRRLDAQYLKGKGRIGMRTLSLVDQAAAPVRRSLFILLGAVVLVLVIACVNITNLLIARTTARGRELAVRAALGAGAARLARQLVTENVLLALIGAAVGLFFAAGGTRLMLALVPGQLPRADDVTVDWRVLLAAATSAVLAGSLFGLAAAVHARRAPAGLHASGARPVFGAARRSRPSRP